MLLLRTLVDIGPRRLIRRLRYELRQSFDRILPPPPLALACVPSSRLRPAWWHDPCLSTIDPPPASSIGNSALFISFTFLNESRHMDWPLVWNDSSWPRLWQFHLHYFDWARSWLNEALLTGQWPVSAWALEPLLDQWTVANLPGRGDGWHSYTLSLRSRNWIQLFRHCPALITTSRLQSLWKQLCWLQAHPEHCHGGNHWLENLTALALGGLQFEGSTALAMHHRAMDLLQKELDRQLLPDGGHHERSASYHLLMLDRLVELADLLESRRYIRPPWLLESVQRMTAWAAAIKLDNGGFPRFNDSAADSCRPIGAVIASAQRHLASAEVDYLTPGPQPQLPLIDLADTGWTFLRPGNGWELAFKCGTPCPRHLAAHAHSDLLSFDLWNHGEPVITEVGTSVYESGHQRQFERSSAAHNSIQLGLPNHSSSFVMSKDEVSWIEPVEVWSSFRAGRKAQPNNRSHGQNGPWFWAAGSHNGFHIISAQHYRWLGLRLSPSNLPVLVIIDAFSASQPLCWRGWWHLGPGLSPSLLELGLQWHCLPSTTPRPQPITTGYIASGFGTRQSRTFLRRCGSLPFGQHLVITVLAPQGLRIQSSPLSSVEGSLRLTDLGSIHWRWPTPMKQHSFQSIPSILIDD